MKVAPFNAVQDVREGDTVGIGSDYAADLSKAVELDHPCYDDSACDIAHALEAGAPLTAAGLLYGATECAHIDAVIAAHRFNGTMTHDPRHDMYRAPDWEVWKAYHDENGRECPSCGAFNYSQWDDTCGNCLAELTTDDDDDDDGEA